MKAECNVWIDVEARVHFSLIIHKAGIPVPEVVLKFARKGVYVSMQPGKSDGDFSALAVRSLLVYDLKGRPVRTILCLERAEQAPG